MAAPPAPSLRLSELLGALSHALDLTEGQPEGHCVRVCWMGLRIGQSLGLHESELRDVYYTALLKDLGCSSNAARICQLYLADDRSFKRDFKTVGSSLPQVLRFILSHTGLKAGMTERFRALANIVQNGGSISHELIETRCQRGAEIARQMRFPEAVAAGIQSLDEHWDGGGLPDGAAGDTIPLPSRIAILAQVADVFHRAGGRAAALAEVKQRAGTWFDPALVASFEAVAGSDAFWATLESPDLDRIVFGLEPAQHSAALDEDYLDDIAAAFARVVDSKSPWTHGHSERVAVFTDLISEELGFSAADRRRLLRGALLHDIGKLGVSNQILDKPGKLDEGEMAEMRRHTTMGETILSRVGAFADFAKLAGSHHERLDGQGYPRGLIAGAIDLDTRILTTADIFDALTAERPYRAAMPTERALGIMRGDLGAAIDPDCFSALERAVAKLDGAESDAAAARAA